MKIREIEMGIFDFLRGKNKENKELTKEEEIKEVKNNKKISGGCYG